MAKIDLSKYGITGTTEIVHNPSYEMLFEEETKPELKGYEKGQVSELGCWMVVVFVLVRSPPYSIFGVLINNDEFIFWRTSGVDTSHNVNSTKLADLTFFVAFQLWSGLFLE